MKRTIGIILCSIIITSLVSCASLKSNKDIAPYLEKIETVKEAVEPISESIYFDLLNDFRDYLIKSKSKVDIYIDNNLVECDKELDTYYQELIDIVEEKILQESK